MKRLEKNLRRVMQYSMIVGTDILFNGVKKDGNYSEIYEKKTRQDVFDM